MTKFLRKTLTATAVVAALAAGSAAAADTKPAAHAAPAAAAAPAVDKAAIDAKFKGDKNATSTVKTPEAKVAFVADEKKKKPVLKPKSEKPAAKAEPVAEADAPADETTEA